MVTGAVGWLVSTTVKVAVPPASSVSPLMAETVTPALSLSVLVTLDIGRVEAVVVGIGAGGRFEADRVGDIAVVQGVVDAGDGHGLGHVPVGAVKVRRGLSRRALGRIAAGEVDGDRRGRLAGEHHGEGGACRRPRRCRR